MRLDFVDPLHMKKKGFLSYRLQRATKEENQPTAVEGGLAPPNEHCTCVSSSDSALRGGLRSDSNELPKISRIWTSGHVICCLLFPVFCFLFFLAVLFPAIEAIAHVWWTYTERLLLHFSENSGLLLAPRRSRKSSGECTARIPLRVQQQSRIASK